MAYAFLAGGLLLLVFGGSLVSRGAIDFARALGLPPLAIALVITSIAATAPEFFVALEATGRTSAEVVPGAIIGGNIANMLLVLGLGAIVRPLPAPPRVVFRDGGTMLAASVLALIMASGGRFTCAAGILLLICAVAYIVLAFVTEWRRPPSLSLAECRVESTGNTHGGVGFFLVLVGLACLFFGARYAIDGGLVTSRQFGLPEAALGLAVLGGGVALPDLFATVSATFTGRRTEIAGQIIAASIFNVFLVIGVLAVIHPLAVPSVVCSTGIAVMATAALLLVPLLMASWRITRVQGVLLVGCYTAWIAFMVLRNGRL